MCKLVICEKPSVALTISKVLGASRRSNGYLEGNGYVVSWCIGHLVELAQPECYEKRYAKWRREDLPIIPRFWKYQISAGTKKQFSILKQLMLRPDIGSLICATDAGREGELIFRLVYHQCGCKKPFERLWISSMEDDAIRNGFSNLKPGTEYDALYEAALCRERADWIVGINATRFFSCLYGTTLNVGRVMTPTLGMVVLRETAISAFIPEPFYVVQLEADGFLVSSERFKEKNHAQNVRDACRKARNGTVSKAESHEKSEKPPALYDLTSLQRNANRLFGFTAQQTLDYAQSLYEKKLITYPRTDSRYLTEDMAATLPGLIRDTAQALGTEFISSIYIKSVINNQKVSDHHALIPTTTMARMNLSALPAGEQSVLRMIAARMLAAVGKPYRYAETTVEINCADTVFTAKGKEVLDEGWKAIERQFLPNTEKAERKLPAISEGSTFFFDTADLKEGRTSPPKHFTEDLLLQAMENAGSETFPANAERKGIGTPATRAAIIEKLVKKGYLERKGNGKVKTLMPTPKGNALIAIIPESLRSSAMTADWEEKLSKIEAGKYKSKNFMDEIADMMTELVNTYKAIDPGKNTQGGSNVSKRS